MAESYIDPSREAWEVFKGLPRGEPIQMLNLIRLKPKAEYPADHPDHGTDLSGLDAYRAYVEQRTRCVRGEAPWSTIAEWFTPLVPPEKDERPVHVVDQPRVRIVCDDRRLLVARGDVEVDPPRE